MAINLERIPIGIKYLKENDSLNDTKLIQTPDVNSYCAGVNLLQSEDYPNGLIVNLDSIKSCKWCPVALGLKTPETGLEKKIEPLFDDLNDGVYIFNMTDKITEPDAVTLVSDRENVEKIINLIGFENFTEDYFDNLLFSIQSEFSEVEYPSKRAQRKRKRNLRHIRIFQRLFGSKLISNKLTAGILTFMLKRYAISRVMDPILRKYSTGISLCYSVSAIPLTTQKANISFPCTGAIVWGDVSKDSLLVGLPNSQYEKLKSNFNVPSK